MAKIEGYLERETDGILSWIRKQNQGGEQRGSVLTGGV